MKKVTAFIGSNRKKNTYFAVQEFEKNLRRHEEVEFDYVFLSEQDLGYCLGCKTCFDKGEELCPLNDDRDKLLAKIEDSDGVVFASPNYAFHTSALMKNFIDRTAFVFHRPRYFGKAFTAIVSQGVLGGNKIRKYLESTGGNLGFSVSKGCCVTTLEPLTENQIVILKEEAAKAADRFYENLKKSEISNPSLFRLMMFRMTRSNIKNNDVKLLDYYYFNEQGWFESDYYHDTSLGAFKKTAGRVFDYAGRRMVKKS